ncbi:MAG: NifB/NifX family molybdenum-iron cluster-binding protein [Desulfobacterales bacterium]|nr:NifB/NifX family molybdenum-iron cluster-binding protein [Desulfobacterales bacterium]
MNTIIAVPSASPGGLDAPLQSHFGHCDLYTLVTLGNSEILDVQVVPNIPHQQGGCMAPVQYLAEKQVQTLIAGGMGLRPLMGFNQAGIEVYYGGTSATVGSAVKELLNDRLQRFSQDHTCGGSAAGGCH